MVSDVCPGQGLTLDPECIAAYVFQFSGLERVHRGTLQVPQACTSATRLQRALEPSAQSVVDGRRRGWRGWSYARQRERDPRKLDQGAAPRRLHPARSERLHLESQIRLVCTPCAVHPFLPGLLVPKSTVINIIP